MSNFKKFGFTIVELMVTIFIVCILLAIFLPAVVAIRESMRLASCQNTMRQLALALHQYHDSMRSFPSATKIRKNPYGQGWYVDVLPYLDNLPVSDKVRLDTAKSSYLFDHEAHPFLSTPLSYWQCAQDPRMGVPQLSITYQKEYALTSFLGVNGTRYEKRNGVLFDDSAIPLSAVLDGTSNTLLIGERPSSDWFDFGWWYAGVGFGDHKGAGEHHLGILEKNQFLKSEIFCPQEAFGFLRDQTANPCSDRHFWSLHANGGNFALVDGSVSFYSYGSEKILADLATRSGAEIVAD